MFRVLLDVQGRDLSEAVSHENINKQVHIIGGWSDKHYIFNKKTEKFDIIHHTFGERFAYFGLIKVDSRDIILAIGGGNDNYSEYVFLFVTRTVYIYLLEEEEGF